MICTIRLYKYIDIVKRNHLSVAQYKVCVFMTSRCALHKALSGGKGLMVLTASVAVPLWTYSPGRGLVSVDMVSTSPVPFLLVVVGPVQLTGHRGGGSHCLPR